MRKFYLLLLSCCVCTFLYSQSVLDPNDSVITYNPNNPPTQPAWGQIGKWVRTKRLSWNTNEYKCYIYKGCAFRLHFPKTYNPTANDGKKYPMMVFFHGLGETGSIYDNEYQLYHGGDDFQAAVDNGTFDGYILCMQSQGFWGDGQYQYITEIIDYMVANNKLDPFQVSDNGLSAGGQGTWQMLLEHPSYISSSLPMSNVEIGYKDSSTVNTVKFTPMWLFQGGKDGAPAPSTAQQVRDAMWAAGGDFTYTEFSTLGHNTWDSAWLMPDFWPFQLRAYASNPWPLFGRTQFCPTDTINETLGLAPGFTAYQWRYNGNIINGATSNTIQATQAGTYDARVERNGIWSDWSRTPVQIVVQSATPTPPIEISGLMSQVIPAPDGKTSVDLKVSGNGNYVSYVWKKIGSDSVYSIQPTFTATEPGYYVVAASQPYSCSSLYSAPFKVIAANGPNAPEAVKSLLANSLSNTQVQLAWSKASQQSNAATAYEIYRGTSSGVYSYIGQAGAGTNSYIDSNLAAKVKYYYVVRAVDSTGAAPVSNEASATTYSDTIAPSIPQNLAVTYTTPSTITIGWSASTDNVAVDHYAIYIDGKLSNVTSQTTFVLTGLNQNQSYAITVKAVDASGNYSYPSSQVSSSPVLGGLQYKYYTTPTAWSVLPDFSSLTPVKSGISSNTDITVATQTTNYGFLWQGYIQVPVDGSYTFQTTSDDGSALWFNSLNPVGTPTVNNDGLHGTKSVTSSSMSLTAGVYPICIEFFQAGGGYNMSVSWACSALFGNTTQHTIDNKYFTGTTPDNGSVPAVPTNVAATAVAFNTINLVWNDNSNNETGFEIYRSLSEDGTYTIVGSVAANITTFSDTTLSPSTTYYYKLQAVNKYGNSGLSTSGTSAGTQNGLQYSYYTGSWSSLPDFSTMTPVKTGFSSTTDLSVATQSSNYGFMWQGYIKLTKSGNYTFGTTSDDGSKLWFNSLLPEGTPTVNNDGKHSKKSKTGSSIYISAGTYPICIEYFQATGSASMTATYKVPSSKKQVTIPSSIFYQPVVATIPSATTFALPATPMAPGNFVATASSASQINLTWNASANATGYVLSRSIGDSTTFITLANIGSGAVSYSDTGLNANIVHYYKLKANGAGGTSSAASVASATTLDNAPVINQIDSIEVPFGTTTTVVLNATDKDGDVLTYSSSNLPAFANINNSTNNSTLVLNPSEADSGVYHNLTITVDDGHGGTSSTTFKLIVNDNYPPTMDSIADYTMNENDVVNIPLTAQDVNTGNVLTWSVANVPNAYTLTDNGNGSATLSLHPDYLAAGTYQPVVKVNDGNGGTASRSFKLIVNDISPNMNIYTRFQYIDTIGAPWNSITSSITHNLKDAAGNTTNVGIEVQGPWFTTYNTGSPTGNNSGVYPDAVLSDYLYFGIFGGPETLDTKIVGLDTSKTYNLTFFGSSTFPGTPDNGSTIYTVGNVSDTLYVQGNTKNTVTISNVKPDADGTILFTMSKDTNAAVGYINALVINYTYDDGTAPAAATNLTAQNVDGKSVQLNWKDVAYNETGYIVYRATSENGTYTVLDTTIADVNSYIDSAINGNTEYFYKVEAFNTHGNSGYSNIDSITTTNRIPQLIAINDVALKSNQTASVNITANDDSTDHITFTLSGLPAFATFTDNGNGTGVINITPNSNSLGAYPVSVIATDQEGASDTTAFNILVSDPNISSTYLSFSDGAHSVPKPWNMLAGFPFAGTSFSNINDDSNTPTGMTVTFKNGFSGVVQSGMQPVDGTGIYPNVVMRTAEFEQGTQKDTIQISGLSSSNKYNFVFFNSHDDGMKGNTNFTIGSTTVTLNATGNISKTVQINGVTPTNGIVNVVIQKATGSDYAFISTMIIQSYASNYSSLSPTNLKTTTITRNSIGLQWEDRAYSETGYQIWRAADSAGSYSLLATVGAGVTSYTDANLLPNKTYNYAVRAVLGTNNYTAFSNQVKASTYAYSVYLNYNAGSDYATLPWNNTDALPEDGYTWNNFFDEKGFTTSTGMELTSNWAGMYGAGMTTTNNSGAVPDAVMIDSYGLFPGQTATFKITGLNIGMKYNFTFFASSQAYGDVNTAYTINGVTTILNTSLNTNSTQTIYGVTPDQDGNVTISVYAATATSQYGLLGAMIIGAYTPSVSSVVPSLPSSNLKSKQTTEEKNSAIAAAPVTEELKLKAYPVPFHDFFNLQLSAKSGNRYQVNIYDITGKIVYSNNLGNTLSGTNTFRIQPNTNLSAGVYTVVIINIDTKSTKTIKLMKE